MKFDDAGIATAENSGGRFCVGRTTRSIRLPDAISGQQRRLHVTAPAIAGRRLLHGEAELCAIAGRFPRSAASSQTSIPMLAPSSRSSGQRAHRAEPVVGTKGDLAILIGDALQPEDVGHKPRARAAAR